MPKLIGPFSQLLTMNQLPLRGPLRDEELEIIPDAGVLVNHNKIIEVGGFAELFKKANHDSLDLVEDKLVAMPGFIDAHTHICYGGSRAMEYSQRISGESYESILSTGGGIHHTVSATRSASYAELLEGLKDRVMRHFLDGVTTIEVKSGYGLSAEEELRQLRVIREVGSTLPAEIISTCLAAHVVPLESRNEMEYLGNLIKDLLPVLKKENLTHRIDIFIEQNSFSPGPAKAYLQSAKDLEFDLAIHADQFSVGGSRIAVELQARSADHLEASGDLEIKRLAASGTAALVLPGSSMGLGVPFARARSMLDSGCILVIASDWNPGSAPMGDLLLQASVLSAFEKLSAAETFAAITCRAAHALGRDDIGRIAPGKLADLVGFSTPDYREILYHQGKLKPSLVWKNSQKFVVKS